MPRSWTVIALALAAIAGACTPARHEVQTDVVKGVAFKGNGGVFDFGQNDYTLAGAMEQGSSRWGVTTWPLMYWVTPVAYDPVALDRDAWRLELWYAHHGWFDARFDGWEVIRLRPRRENFGGVVRIVGHVSPGAPSVVRDYTIGGLERPVLAPFETSLRRTGALQQGDQFQLEALDSTQTQLISSLNNNGFPYAKAQSGMEAFPEEHAVDVTIGADAGLLSEFGDVTIAGNDKVATRAIRDSVTFEPGEVWDSRQLTRTQERIFQLGTFAVVNVQPDLSDPTVDTIPVEVSVTEAQFQSIRVGGGLSYKGATLTPRISVEYRHSNLFHRLLQIKAKGSLGYGFRPQRGAAGLSTGTPVYELGLEASTPYLGSPTVGLFVGGDIKQDIQGGQYTYFNPTAHAGFTWKPLKGLVFSIGPEFELYKFLDLDAEGLLVAKQLFGPEFVNPYTLTKLVMHATWDRRDDPASPTRGTYYALGVEQAFPINEWLGGPSGFLYTQLNWDGRVYVRPRVGRTLPFVAAMRLQGQILLPWASNDYLPYSEKAFLGGSSNMRGFLIDQVGPYDCICSHEAAEKGNGFGPEPGAGWKPVIMYLPKGGVFETSLMTEFSYNFAGNQSVAFFGDVGLLIEKSSVFDAQSLRFGGGIGYRYKTSLGPFRFDIAARPLYNEDKGPVDKPGCTTSDDAGPRSYDFFGAIFPKQRDDEFRKIPFALNLYLAIGGAF